jgi:hypothetical protein
MTIHQLADPCWTIVPKLPVEDGGPCYGTRAGALAAIREAWDEDRERVRGLAATVLEEGWRREFRWLLSRLRPGAPRPRQMPARCWVVQCDGECEMVLDEEDECCVYHHRSAAEAASTVASCEWVYSADGRLVFCEEDAPEDAAPPPLSPAEQEAAGQLVIPGVIP